MKNNGAQGGGKDDAAKGVAKGNGGRKCRARHSHTASRHVMSGGDVKELAAHLAPLEEQDAAAGREQGDANTGGSIVVDTGKLTLPSGIGEEEGRKLILGFEPVVVVIVAAMIAFVLFIAWEISRMPPPPGG
jgi:hypothetical protein